MASKKREKLYEAGKLGWIVDVKTCGKIEKSRGKFPVLFPLFYWKSHVAAAAWISVATTFRGEKENFFLFHPQVTSSTSTTLDSTLFWWEMKLFFPSLCFTLPTFAPLNQQYVNTPKCRLIIFKSSGKPPHTQKTFCMHEQHWSLLFFYFKNPSGWKIECDGKIHLISFGVWWSELWQKVYVCENGEKVLGGESWDS